MQVKLTDCLEVEVAVRGCVDRTVQPHGFDPGDPGGASLEAVLLSREGLPDLDILPYLDSAAIATLEATLYEVAVDQAADAAQVAAEARYDAMKEGE